MHSMHMHSTIASICILPIYQAPFSLLLFANMRNGGQGKVGIFDYQSGNS